MRIYTKSYTETSKRTIPANETRQEIYIKNIGENLLCVHVFGETYFLRENVELTLNCLYTGKIKLTGKKKRYMVTENYI